MKIKITSDSTCDLSPELIKKYDIDILPLYVVMGDDTLKDGIEATPKDIYEFVDKTGVLPKTSAPNLSDFIDLFKKYTEQGFVTFCIDYRKLDDKATSVVIVDIKREVTTQVLGMTFGKGKAEAESFGKVVDLGERFEYQVVVGF